MKKTITVLMIVLIALCIFPACDGNIDVGSLTKPVMIPDVGAEGTMPDGDMLALLSKTDQKLKDFDRDTCDDFDQRCFYDLKEGYYKVYRYLFRDGIKEEDATHYILPRHTLTSSWDPVAKESICHYDGKLMEQGWEDPEIKNHLYDFNSHYSFAMDSGYDSSCEINATKENISFTIKAHATIVGPHDEIYGHELYFKVSGGDEETEVYMTTDGTGALTELIVNGQSASETVLSGAETNGISSIFGALEKFLLIM